MKTKEQLQSEQILLINSINSDNYDEISAMLKENERQLKEIKITELLNQVNNKYTRIREMAKQAWECEQPNEDITCADGSFHKTKVKKYPIIASLEYCRAKWEDNRITEIRINGERFTMYQAKYEYNKETTYTRPESFEAFLGLNSIPLKDITIDEYKAICDKLGALNEKLSKDIEEYKNGLNSLNYSSLNHWGLIGQHPLHLYEYTPNKN